MGSIPIFCWNGKYFGFISNGKFFKANGDYLGWVDDDNRVWHSNGRFLGEIVEDNYILRRASQIEPITKIPQVRPNAPIPPIPSINRVGRIPRGGWQDALDGYE